MLIIFLASFFSFFDFLQPPHIVEADKISSNFLKIVKKDGLYNFGMGGELFDSIESFSFHLACNDKKLTKEEYRKIIIENSELLYHLVNNHSAKPYIRKFPYDEHQGTFSIIFLDKKGGFYPDPEIAKISIVRGFVFFSKYEEKTGFIEISREPYSEAYEKVYGVPLPDRKVQFGVK